MFIDHNKDLKSIIMILCKAEEVNKIALSANDHKRLQKFDRITNAKW